jgi:cold shock CspA family protein
MAETRVLGKVKWFNYQNGYGFITPLEESDGGEDIFVHHTSIHVNGNHYKYLVEGEYVEYTLENVNSREHKCHAVDITGIKRNTLMCETRNNTRQKTPQPTPQTPRQNSPFPPQLRRTSSVEEENDGFVYPTQRRISKK